MQLADTCPTLLVCLTACPGKGEESRETGSKVTQTAAKPEEQPMPAVAAPVQKKKLKDNSIHMVRDEDPQNQRKR